MASYGAIPSVERSHRARAAPMLALMGLAVVAVVAVVALTAQSRSVEMVAFPQDDLGILKEMVSAVPSVQSYSSGIERRCFGSCRRPRRLLFTLYHACFLSDTLHVVVSSVSWRPADLLSLAGAYFAKLCSSAVFGVTLIGCCQV